MLFLNYTTGKLKIRKSSLIVGLRGIEPSQRKTKKANELVIFSDDWPKKWVKVGYKRNRNYSLNIHVNQFFGHSHGHSLAFRKGDLCPPDL